MRKQIITICMIATLMVLGLSLQAFSESFIMGPGGEAAPIPSTDSSQPDTIRYENYTPGQILFWNGVNYWGMVRFTSPSDFELRCIYILMLNNQSVQDGVTVTVHESNGGQPGNVISGPYNVSGPLWVGGTWLDVELREPFPQLTAAQEFFVKFGPAPGGTTGWYIYLDNNGNTNGRTQISPNSTGPWSSDPPGDLFVRAGGEVASYTDLTVTSCYNQSLKFFSLPGTDINLKADVQNVGPTDVDDFKVKWVVENAAGVEVFTDSAEFGALTSGSTVMVDCPHAWTANPDGYYVATATVTHEDDVLLENNVASLEQGIGTDEFGWMTYDDGDPNASIAGSPGIGWGNVFVPTDYPIKVDSVRVFVAEAADQGELHLANLTTLGVVDLWTYNGPLVAGSNVIDVSSEDINVFSGGIGIAYIYQTAAIFIDATPPTAGTNEAMPAVAYEVQGTTWTESSDGDWLLSVYCVESTAQPPEPEISFDPDTLDFGDVQVGVGSMSTVIVHNDGEAILSVTDIEVSPELESQMAFFTTQFNVQPGSSYTVQAIWTASNPGPMEGTFNFINNATEPDPAVLQVRGLAIGDGVVQQPGVDPVSYELNSNYPNPFNSSTTFSFSLPVGENVIFKIYDVTGKEVSSLVDRWVGAGRYDVTFDAASLPSGVYIYRMTAGDFTASGKMIYMK